MISSNPVRFSSDIPFTFLVSCTFCLCLCLCLSLFFFFELNIFELKKISFDTHLTMRAGGDKNIFSWPASGNKTIFLALYKWYKFDCYAELLQHKVRNSQVTKPSYAKWRHSSSYKLENFFRNFSFEFLTRLHKILN